MSALKSEQVKYHLPVLSTPDIGLFRSPGAGLGNILFPISRALVAKETEGGVMVFPTMRQIKVGTYIRRERDKRTYGEIFRPRTSLEWSVWMKVQFMRKRLEDTANTGESNVIQYQGLARQFHDIVGHAATIRSYLENASRAPVPSAQFDVAIHVRRGDFAPPNAGASTQNVQVPIDWYREAFHVAKERLGTAPLKGILFSDENPQAVVAELGLPDFRPEPVGNALTSILLMSRARVLIGSRSTFSLWGQFLGESIGIWPQAFDLARYKIVDPALDSFI